MAGLLYPDGTDHHECPECGSTKMWNYFEQSCYETHQDFRITMMGSAYHGGEGSLFLTQVFHDGSTQPITSCDLGCGRGWSSPEVSEEKVWFLKNSTFEQALLFYQEQKECWYF